VSLLEESRDELKTWMDKMEPRLLALGDKGDTSDPKDTFQELLALAEEFIKRSRDFLRLAQLAKRAADEMIQRHGTESVRRDTQS
jgi:hypothetical protein